MNFKSSPDVLVIGGGNAALCAALVATEAGASVRILESSPKAWRGGNSSHTRNVRCMHDTPQDVLVDAYSEEEYWQDLLKVTGGQTNEHLARLVIRSSATFRTWMHKHGVRFQPSLSGALHTARTNAFFMGGGKALVNAYYLSAKRHGITVDYNARVSELKLVDGRFQAARVIHTHANGETQEEWVHAKTCILACGGFESNREWLREAWGQNASGEWSADNFLIRGSRYNQGEMLKFLMGQGADIIGDPTQAHMVAIDARAPLYDGGICTRLDSVSLGVVVNQNAERFYDEGEDFWPKRYAIWGRLVAQQPQQIGYSIIDSKAIGRFMPPVFEAIVANTLPELAAKLELNVNKFMQTMDAFNASCVPGDFDHTVLDNCHTEGVHPAKTHWARTIDIAPFYAYPLRPGVTFTYLGLKTDETTAVHFSGVPSPNLFAAGEIMAGNVLGKGYTAGVGMTIGTFFGRQAGAYAAKAALEVGALA
jgi:tricarballylate dehydrogenase